MSSPKIAIITGAGTGIGKATAQALLGAGYRVTLAGRRAEPLHAVVAELAAKPDEALVVPTDVADPASVKAMFAATVQRWGRVDVLFNNAGVGAPGVPLEELTIEQWKQVVDINLNGMFYCIQQAFTKTASLDGRKYNIAVGQIDVGNAGTDMAMRMATGILQANGQIAVEPLMDVNLVGQAVLHMANLPLEANVMFQTIMATKMPFAGRG